MTATPNSLSIIIPVYNGGENFQKCLASLKSTLQPDDEVIVVSDGETDGSWRIAKTFGAKVVRLKISGGPARARNTGATMATGDILLFLDADVTVHPNTLDLIRQRFQESSELAALIGSYDDRPEADNFLSQYKNLFHHYTHQVSSETAFTFWGACGAIRRSVFEAVNGFDEGYHKPCIEDIELGYRLKQAHYSIALCKDIQVKHLKRWDIFSLLKTEFFYRALPWTKLILCDRSSNHDLNLSSTNQLSVILIFALISSSAATRFTPWLSIATLCLGLSLLLINLDVYRFFYNKRGLLFSLRAIPWHWLYFLYGGLAFIIGTISHCLDYLYASKPVTQKLSESS
ncbi:glycosyltransferase [Leptolyngbya sp. Heron Island J]|uniref:glycosyltransferase n=1 Tax=Leptolyngbya sp. Heron Island J TaxID=1385935 RepID=UPI0003B98275|nr:glycosyltransferase [Leptolyngbya sp. Heron Island J]ESA35789.1 glycosyltransferase [Leptolyngbya sp. Heron Island J]